MTRGIHNTDWILMGMASILLSLILHDACNVTF